jgi:hypothetical protein
MLICLAYMALYLAGLGDKPTVTLAEVITDAIWWIFLLATAAVLSDKTRSANYYSLDGDSADKLRASCAFAWLTFFLWTGSAVLSVKGLMDGRGGGAPAGTPGASVV